MEQHKLTCIICPKGCSLHVEIKSEGAISISGHTCKRGESYGKKEITNPTRILTTTVCIESEIEQMLPVKTDIDIPKDKILLCAKALKKVMVQAPIQVGDIIVENILETGANVVATKEIMK